MRHIYLIVLVICTLLAGCDDEFSPLVAVEISDLGINSALPQPKKWKLSAGQLKPLERWLGEHDSEGGMLLVTPPVPSLVMLLTHANGSRSTLGLFSSAQGRWENAVLVGSLNKSRIKGISAAEREMLLQLMQEIPD